MGFTKFDGKVTEAEYGIEVIGGKCCVTLLKVTWQSELHLPTEEAWKKRRTGYFNRQTGKEIFGDSPWSAYRQSRAYKKDSQYYYFGFKNYAGLKVHENHHLHDYETHGKYIIEEYSNEFTKNNCFKTRPEAEKRLKEVQGQKEDIQSKLRYGKAIESKRLGKIAADLGFNVKGEGDKEGWEPSAVTAERAFHEAQYKLWLKSQKEN